jgi:hypothetical protein
MMRRVRAARPLYVAMGVAAIAVEAAASTTRGVVRAAAPLGRAVLQPAMLIGELHPARAVGALADRGRGALARRRGGTSIGRLPSVVPVVVREVLGAQPQRHHP